MLVIAIISVNWVEIVRSFSGITIEVGIAFSISIEIKNKLLALKQQLQATTAELLTTITIDPEQTVQGRTVKLSNQALRDAFIAENTVTVANDINESYKKLNRLQAVVDKESDMILFYDIITRK